MNRYFKNVDRYIANNMLRIVKPMLLSTDTALPDFFFSPLPSDANIYVPIHFKKNLNNKDIYFTFFVCSKVAVVSFVLVALACICQGSPIPESAAKEKRALLYSTGSFLIILLITVSKVHR